MIRYLFISALTMLSIFSTAIAQTATDFTADDCNGVSHNLFNELDEGKIVIIAWVMPCFTCIEDPVNAYTSVIENYESDYPGKINFYLVDDYANTSCDNLNNWAEGYGLDGLIMFSDVSISMSDYGTNGMPKIVILGGATEHKVYYNENSSTTGFNDALDLALSESMTVTSTEPSLINLYPNPALNYITIENNKNEVLEACLYNDSGKLIKPIKVSALENKQLDLSSLTSGVYYIKSKGLIQARFVKP